MKVKSMTDQLSEELFVMVSINCTHCNKTEDMHHIDDYEAANRFTKKGWIMYANNDGFRTVACPDCVKQLNIQLIK